MRGLVSTMVCMALCFASTSLCAEDAASAAQAIVDKMPAQSGQDSDKYAAELVKLGPEGIGAVCSMLVPPGKGDDTKARYALSSLTWYVLKPGTAEAEARAFSGAVSRALNTATNKEVQAFLIRRLQLGGRDECVPALADYLADDRLCEPAAQALTAIGTPTAAAALIEALPAAEGKRLVTMIKALGELRAVKAGEQIVKHAGSQDADTRLVALYALGNIGPKGHSSAAAVLEKAARSKSPCERSKATTYYLLFARRAAEEGDKKQCAGICRDLIKTRAKEQNARSAALSTLVSALGEQALPDLLAAADDESRQLRFAVLALAETIPGKKATAAWARQVRAADAGKKVEIIAMLGRRGDKSAAPVLVEAIRDKEQAVRLAAIGACADLGGTETVGDLLTALKTCEGGQEIAAIKNTLIRIADGGALKSVAGALTDVPPVPRVALIQVLALRHAKAHKRAVFAQVEDADAAVRAAAIEALGVLADQNDMPLLVELFVGSADAGQKASIMKTLLAVGKLIEDPERRALALLKAIAGASQQDHVAILGALPQLGGREALAAVVGGTKNRDAAIRDAAVRALSDWPHIDAAAEMVEVMRGSKNLSHQVLATRGLVRLVSGSDMAADKKAAVYDGAMHAAGRPDEKRLILSGLSDVRTMESLEVVAQYLDDAAIRAEAARAVVRIACPDGKQHKGMATPEVKPVLTKTLEATQDAGLRKRIEAQLAKIPGS
jgi:HEAT repeat protein